MGYATTSLASSSKKKDNIIIINNKSSASASSKSQSVVAPNIIPSSATRLRSAREQQEIETEDAIIKQLEIQRIQDEQHRANRLFYRKKPTNSLNQSKNSDLLTQKRPDFYFDNPSFFSIGVGTVQYPQVSNINSTEIPAGFLSVGAYDSQGFISFDLSLYYSKHYIKDPIKNLNDIREAVHQPALSMSIKLAPLSGKVRPYIGVAGALVWRRWFYVDSSTGYSEDDEQRLRDISDKLWNQSFDAGILVGTDILLTQNLGINVDIRYYFNFYTENRKTILGQYFYDIQVLDERDSLTVAANFKYFF